MAKQKTIKAGEPKKSFAQGLAERMNLYICPVLLGASVCYSIIYTMYRELAVPYTAMFLLLELALFAFFDKLKKRRILGGIVYTLILIALVIVSIMLVWAGIFKLRQWNAPGQWFYGADNFDYHQPLFLNALFIGGGYFLISVLYYFTQVRYRTLGLMLCILFPFVIYAKRSNNMPEMMVTVIITLFLAAVVHNRRFDPADPQRERAYTKIDRSYIISAVIFITVTGAVTVSIKKPVFRSQLERDAAYFDYAPSGISRSGSAFESMMRTSSERYGARSLDGRELFTFKTNGERPVYYLRRQSYTSFNGDVWSMGGYSEKWYMYYSYDYPEYSANDVVADFFSLTSPDAQLPDGIIDIRSGIVMSSELAPEYLPAPLATITDNVPGRPEYKKFLADIIQRGAGHANQPLNDSFTFYDQTEELYAFAREAGLTGSEYIETLSSSELPQAQDLLDDYYAAVQEYCDTQGVSNETAELAARVTEGCRSDIEKAEALEIYFEVNGYIYDEDYIPEDTSIDYFIFEGKTGVCSSYATAMTLMARSVGLPARYVEGFAAFERNADGDFIVRDKHSHAFVEVYIPGTGWLTFDPTVSSYMDEEDDEDNGGIDLLWIFERFELVIAAAVLIILWLLRDRLRELAFRASLPFTPPEKAALRLYANVLHLISFSTGEDCAHMTVNMLRSYISDKRGSPPEELFALFEKTAFGGYSPTKDEFRSAYAEYRRCYKYLRRERRNKSKE